MTVDRRIVEPCEQYLLLAIDKTERTNLGRFLQIGHGWIVVTFARGVFSRLNEVSEGCGHIFDGVNDKHLAKDRRLSGGFSKSTTNKHKTYSKETNKNFVRHKHRWAGSNHTACEGLWVRKKVEEDLVGTKADVRYYWLLVERNEERRVSKEIERNSTEQAKVSSPSFDKASAWVCYH